MIDGLFLLELFENRAEIFFCRARRFSAARLFRRRRSKSLRRCRRSFRRRSFSRKASAVVEVSEAAWLVSVETGVASAAISPEELLFACSETERSFCAAASVSLITSFAIINLCPISLSFKIAFQYKAAQPFIFGSNIKIKSALRISQFQSLGAALEKIKSVESIVRKSYGKQR
jgi:hypothetical protein